MSMMYEIEIGDLFELKEEHLTLLSKTYVTWDNCEFGAPSINPKRPYGNSDVMDDMKDILGDYYSERELRSFHKELEIALQIVLRNKTFEPGIFKHTCYYEWERVDANY